MEIKTKFNLGDTVYTIASYSQKVNTKCPICDGKGFVEIKDNDFVCPNKECHEGYLISYEEVKWHVSLKSTIGKVAAEIDIIHNTLRVDYMLKATGIGSGAVWHECKLFATIKEAQERCDKLNNKI